MSSSGKKTKGRQKIEMKKIENEDDRLITFSKRRSGIYKKASELSTLCGVEVGFIVFSPSGKPFSFGHPSIEYIANRYLNQNFLTNSNIHPLVEAHRMVRINQLGHQMNDVRSHLDAAKERTKVMDQTKKRKEIHGWWEAPSDELDVEGLKMIQSSMLHFRNNVYHFKRSKMNEAAFPQMDLSQLTNPFPTSHANENVPAIFPPGYNPGFLQFSNNFNF